MAKVQNAFGRPIRIISQDVDLLRLLLLVTLAQVAFVLAFPDIGQHVQRRAEPDFSNGPLENGQGDAKTPFDPKMQLVSVDGKHKFVPPNFKAGDVRGPCTGLNTMANHGYLPHSGVGTHAQFIKEAFDVFGMGTDLATILTLYAGIMDGNGLEWSVGGPALELPSSLPGVLGFPQGISASHNKYEGDASPLRGDLYMSGDDYKLQLDQWQQLWELGQANDDTFDLDILTEFRSKRFDHSVATNPYFYNGAFTGVLVQPAAYSFIYRFMGNKSAKAPEGLLNGRALMEFMGITQNQNGTFKRLGGYERIPRNWYKRHPKDSYDIQALGKDAGAMGRTHLKFFTIGGNLGAVNILTGVNPENFTNDVYNLRNLAHGNNLLCFALEAAAVASPDLIKCSNVYQDVAKVVSLLNTYVGQSLSTLA